jgi:hypothetical protein
VTGKHWIRAPGSGSPVGGTGMTVETDRRFRVVALITAKLMNRQNFVRRGGGWQT